MKTRTHLPASQLALCMALSVLPQLNSHAGSLDVLPLDDPGIVVRGAQFATLKPDGLHFDRFDATILESTNEEVNASPRRARTTSGVIVSLTSRAPVIRLTFGYDPEHENRGSQFGIYRDGEWLREVSVGKEAANFVIELEGSPDGDVLINHEVVLPSWANPILKRIEISEGCTLEGPPIRQRPKIVFLGDSISHGTGQGSASYRNYPFIASRELGMEGYNLAVGGARISPPIADLLQHFEPVQVIWILVGYNNWQGVSHDIATIRQDYEELLSTVRRHQPEAVIYCCTLTYTRKQVDAESGVPVEAVRETVADIVSQRIEAGDSRLHLVRAEQWTDDSFLPPTKDPVHFSADGAARFADVVVRIIQHDSIRDR